MAELVGNSRSQQLAAGQPSAVLARCWILASAERDRSLNLLGKGGRVSPLRSVSSRAGGRRLSHRFRSGGAGAQLRGLFGASRSKPVAEGFRVSPLRSVSSRAGGRRLSHRFRSGGAGAQLRGLFGASRSKPVAEGWLWRVCALAFQAG